MELKDGDKYVSNVNGTEIELVEKGNNVWFLRLTGKMWCGNSTCFDEDSLKALLKSKYTPKK